MGPIFAVIGAVATVAGTAMAYSSQKRASRTAQRQQELQTARERRQVIREAQIRRAQTVAAGAQQGGLGGSSIAGGLSSLGSQLGSGLGFSTAMSAMSSDINRYNQRAATWSSIAGIGSSMFQAGGGWGALADTFKKKPTAPNTPQATQSSHAARAGF